MTALHPFTEQYRGGRLEDEENGDAWFSLEEDPLVLGDGSLAGSVSAPASSDEVGLKSLGSI
jgi:hypothetical protein